MGRLYSLNGKEELADEAYQRQMKLEPNSPWARINYSRYLLRRRNYDGAIDCARQALEQMDFPMGHHIMAQACYAKAYDLWWKRGQYLESGKYFKLATEHDPVHADAFYGLGLYYRELARNKRSVEILQDSGRAFEQALRINPKHELARQELENHRKFIHLFK